MQRNPTDKYQSFAFNIRSSSDVLFDSFNVSVPSSIVN